MTSRLLRDRRLAVLLLGPMLALAGCGTAPHQNVSMLSLDGSIVFGAPTPGAASPSSPAPGSAAPGFIPGFPFTLPSLTPLYLGAPPPSQVCPTASVTAVPAQAAGNDVTGPPAAGAYQWKQSGTVAEIGSTSVLSGFATHYIRRVSTPTTSTNPFNGQPDELFTYQTVEPLSSAGDSLVLSWQVHTNELSQTTTKQGETVHYGLPDAGLALEQIQYQPASGSPRTLFAPATGLLIMPLPLSSGMSWTSSADDAQDAISVQLQGQVGVRYEVDACGEYVEGWLTTATLTWGGISNGAQFTDSETWKYVFAPQLGGILIGDLINGSTPMAKYTNATYSVAQLLPSPLPASMK